MAHRHSGFGSEDDISVLLYVSALAKGCDDLTVSDIARQAIQKNSEVQVTGLLLFDGTHFAQFVEGPPHAIKDLTRALQRDLRHEGMQVLFQATSLTPRRFPQWAMGYLEVHLGGGLERLRGTCGIQAVAAFDQVLSDISYGVNTQSK